jgi:release factor glutamine methyltransferase
MHHNVLQHEPHLALFVPDEKPLLFYDAIAEYGLTHLRNDGRIYLEINRKYGHEICSLLSRKGYQDIRLLDDQFQNPRFIICSLPQ